MKKLLEFLKKYAESLIAITIALVIIFFVLYQLHTRMGGNIIGQAADALGKRASGQQYQF